MPKQRKTKGAGASISKSEASHPATVGRASHDEVDSTSRADILRRLYATLLRCRRGQECLQRLSPSAPGFDIALGLEAVTVGAIAELTSTDTIAAGSRNVAALLAKGATISQLLAVNGAGPRSAYWAAPFVPEDPFHAGVGMALAHRLEQKRGVVVALCAQQRRSLNAWHGAIKFAVKHRLPIIFVIENDAIHSTALLHLHPLSFVVRNHDFPGIIVDGSDTVAVWRVSQESIHRARSGLGPTLIDCRTDPTRDPLVHMERYLRKRKLWDDAWRQNLESEISIAMPQAGVEADD